MYKDEIIVPVAGSTRELLLRKFKHELDRVKGNIVTFTEELLKDPVYAMNWADKNFKDAAQVQVNTQVVHLLEHCTNLNDVVDALTSNIMNKARYINNTGSSTSSGYLEQCLLSASVEALESFKYLETLE